jgi:hypothetical protein
MQEGLPILTTKWTISGSATPSSTALLWSDATFGCVHWESPIVVQGVLYAHGRERQALGLDAARGAARLYTVTPCRAVDTRQPAGPTGGPSLAGGGAKRRFVITGQCGVPTTTLAVAANVTVVGPAANGDLRLGPSGFAAQTSTINFNMGRIRANNAVIGLTGDPLGSLAVQADLAGSVDLVIDIVGYFK